MRTLIPKQARIVEEFLPNLIAIHAIANPFGKIGSGYMVVRA